MVSKFSTLTWTSLYGTQNPWFCRLFTDRTVHVQWIVLQQQGGKWNSFNDSVLSCRSISHELLLFRCTVISRKFKIYYLNIDKYIFFRLRSEGLVHFLSIYFHWKTYKRYQMKNWNPSIHGISFHCLYTFPLWFIKIKKVPFLFSSC